MKRIVVVGAGSAGAVVAARLSSRPDLSVTLLEAGPDTVAAEDGPSAPATSFHHAVGRPGRTWTSLTATRASGTAAKPYLRGRGVGGSSAVNALVAMRGERGDYDRWERQYGCAGWSWGDVAPWFERTALPLRRAPRAEWGPVNIALAEAVADAAAGVPLTRDEAGGRVSVDDAYLRPVRHRPNLVVTADTLVDRVLLDGRRAVGVRTAAGDEIEADLVVVSAGAIHSPAMLLRSGVDTPGVGENLHDHPSFPIVIELEDPSAPAPLPIATLARLSAGGHHDLQLLPVDGLDRSSGVGLLLAALMRTHSRGRVRLAATAPDVEPTVELAMLDDDRDWLPMAAALGAAARALDHPAMRALGRVVEYDPTPSTVRAGLDGYVHAAGTCAMGTVVDTACRLVGYAGLVVCDASVMPEAPRAGLHLPTVMIAERVAAHVVATLP